MAEILPAVIEHRWTSAPPAKTRPAKYSRLSSLLLLTLAMLFLTGATVGLVAWWKPLTQPVWIILTVAREDTASIARRLAVAGDGLALVEVTRHDKNTIARRDGITRRECEQLLAALHLVRNSDRLCVYIGAAAGLNRRNEVVLYPSDIGPTESDVAIPLTDLLSAIDRCEAGHRLLLLDLSPVDGESPGVAPPVGLGAAVDRVLRKHSASGFLVVTSTSGEEASHDMPGHCRTLFGWLVQHALEGAADGANGTLPDGRVGSGELVDYLHTQLPSLAQGTCGAMQTPALYGHVDEFEITIATGPTPLRNATVDDVEYPKWLTAAWADYRAARASELFAQHLEPFQRMTEALLTAELAWERLAPDVILADLQAELNAAQHAFHTVAGNPVVPTAADTEAAQALAAATADVASYLAAVQQQSAAQPASPVATLQADFLKAHAKTPTPVLAQAIFAVAQQPQSTIPANLQTLVTLLDALPKSPTDENSNLLRALAAVAQTTPAEIWQPEVAVYALRVADNMQALAKDAADWPWIASMLDQAWNDRVRGEVVLLAQGYAPYHDAFTSLQSADEACRLLQQCVATLHAARSTRDDALFALPSQVSRVSSEPAMTAAWLAAAASLREVEAGLEPPAAPPDNTGALRLLYEKLSRSQTNLQSQLNTLRLPLQPTAIAQRISQCKAPGAGPHELVHTARILTSPRLSSEDRKALVKAYQHLSNQLIEETLRGASPVGVPTSSAAKQERVLVARQKMASAWNELPATSQSLSNTSDATIQAQNWREAAYRYRDDQWQRILARYNPKAQLNDKPSWTISGISFLSPLVCDELTRLQNDARLNLAWHMRNDAQAPVQVKVVSPGRALSVVPQQTTLNDRDPVALELRWQPTAQAADNRTIDGFLVELTSAGRSYFAPIALPNLQDQSEVLITLSTTPDKCTPVPDRVELRPHGRPESLFLFVQNNTAKPRQILLQAGSTPLGAPLTLGAEEQKGVPLPDLPSDLTSNHHQLALVAIDANTQNCLGQHTYTINVRRPSDAAEVLGARITNDPEHGVVVSVDLQSLTPPGAAPVDVGLTFDRTEPGAAVRTRGGQLQGVLTNERRQLTLSASGLNFTPGEPIRCGISIDDVSHVLVFEGHTPPFGASEVLLRRDAPTAALVGKSFSTPVAQYDLDVTAANAPPDAQLEIMLVPTVAPLTPLLHRQLPAHPLLSIAWQPTKPPGGISVSASGNQELQTFDTSGLVGRYQWQANLRDQHGRIIATAQLPVVFDDSPPVASRFVSPPATAVKNTKVTLVATAWDELSNIASAQFFVGVGEQGKPPATAKLVPGQRSPTDATLWTAELALPNEAGPTTVSVLFTDGAGLTALAQTTLQVLEAAPTPTASIEGTVLEGSRPQPGLEVILQHANGAEVAKTKTDASGHFSFPNLAAGDYQLHTTKASSQRTAEAKVHVVVGPPTSATLKLAMPQKKV